MTGRSGGEQIAGLLASAAVRPSALVVDGEGGIGKTTMWWAGVEQARERGFRLLQAWPGPTEVALTLAALADLLGDVEQAVVDELPDVQQAALDRALSRAAAGPASDERVLGAALVNVLERLAADAPVLIAIDDAHWLDVSSQAALAFACRRLRGRVGVLATVRTGEATGWLRLRQPHAVTRFRVPPLTLGGLHTLLSERLGRSLPRPTMVRIAETSGGNPFYALELAQAIIENPPRAQAGLSTTLSALVRERIGPVDGDVGDVLLAIASTTDPTVELIAQAAGHDAAHVVAVLETAESEGVLMIDGNRLRFAHPLLSDGFYATASPPRRRAMHARLAELVEQPEVRARHLALAATSADEETLRALDSAADAARSRGAPATAAELLDLAIGLGGDDPVRRMRSAAHHFRAGDVSQARLVLQPAIDGLPPGGVRALALTLLAGLGIYDNSYAEAIPVLEQVIVDADGDPALEVQALMLLSFAQSSTGAYDEALRSANRAVADAEQLGAPSTISQTLAIWLVVNCLCGNGIDEAARQRALQLEDVDADMPIICRASAESAQLLALAGRLDEARTAIAAVRRRCEERGAETDLLFVGSLEALIAIWQGRFGDATQIADDALERAGQLGGDHPLAIALTLRGAAAGYLGHTEQARADAQSAVEAAHRCGSPRLADWPTMNLGLLEVSLGDYTAALEALAPLTAQLLAEPQRTEILFAAFVPDAVEAMVALGRPDDAEALIGALERNGARLDRAWMLAVGARCRALWLAARGELAEAEDAARQALVEHERLAMPFETARTRLLLGQLQRRRRRREAAARTLTAARQTFEELGTPLWAERARAELARTRVGRGDDATVVLTGSERRIAELAASGMTNRDIAAELFVSPKTVEFNLSRVYRKLDIRKRAQLHGRLAEMSRENPDSSMVPRR